MRCPGGSTPDPREAVSLRDFAKVGGCVSCTAYAASLALAARRFATAVTCCEDRV